MPVDEIAASEELLGCGTAVIICNLQKAVHMNGKQAEIRSFDEAKGRYVVRLWSPTGNGRKLNVMPQNITELTGAAPRCTRCLRDSTKGKCLVPHPAHHRTWLYSCGNHSTYDCGACAREYSGAFQNGSFQCTSKGQACQWCFQGEHTTKPISNSDSRRVLLDEMHLRHGPDLQQQIDSISNIMPDVRVLTITDSSGGFDDSNKNLITLNHRLPRLKVLHLLDIPFERITLNDELTPELSKLKLQNVPDGRYVKACDLDVQCSELSEFSIQYWQGEARIINKLLTAATKLRTFDSYKLWIVAAPGTPEYAIDISSGNLAFASNQLESIDLHRADSLPSLSIWAPNLTSLRLDGCYSLEQITFLHTHPLASSLSEGHQHSEFEVSTTNAVLGPRAQAAIQSNPRALCYSSDDDDYGGFGAGAGLGSMSGFEAFFAQMHKTGW
eukprot:COSAG02_NODE_17_length_55377_cov_106.402258_24_plen_441_part_00